MEIRSASSRDLPQILTLLREAELPQLGVDGILEQTLVIQADGYLIGTASLEVYGNSALLRSVAIHRDHRGQGSGTRLVEAALALARKSQVKRVYLLTESATGFFQRLGFRVISRSEVDEAVQRSAEFTSLCPASATCMALELE